jgi:hypothetical protein
VGPFYDAAGVRALTRLTPAELARRGAAGDVLEVITSDGTPLYPTFQLGPRGELLPALRILTQTLLPTSDDSWDVALWLMTPSAAFDGKTAAELLKVGEDEPVLSAAQRDAERLSR